MELCKQTTDGIMGIRETNWVHLDYGLDIVYTSDRETFSVFNDNKQPAVARMPYIHHHWYIPMSLKMF